MRAGWVGAVTPRQIIEKGKRARDVIAPESLGSSRTPEAIARKRQAWIDYGAALAQCPHRKGSDVGAWVRENGLDFVSHSTARTEARRLYNFTESLEVEIGDCPFSNPRNVLQWLQAQGRIPANPARAAATAAARAAPVRVSVSRGRRGIAVRPERAEGVAPWRVCTV